MRNYMYEIMLKKFSKLVDNGEAEYASKLHESYIEHQTAGKLDIIDVMLRPTVERSTLLETEKDINKIIHNFIKHVKEQDLYLNLMADSNTIICINQASISINSRSGEKQVLYTNESNLLMTCKVYPSIVNEIKPYVSHCEK